MASLLENYFGKVINKNRKYWCLREIAPTEDRQQQSSSEFILQNKKWRCFAYLKNSSLAILVFSEGVIDNLFNVRVGIFGESGENIVMSNAKALTIVEYNVVDLISYSQLNSLVQSNELYILYVEIEKKDEEKEQKAKVYKRKFETDYKELLLSGKKSDFTINVKHRKFNCHALILGARSPVFSAMMEHEMKEKRNGEVFITDADPDIFQGFLLYLYTGKEEHLNWKNITDLYKLGDKYCVDDLKYLCVEHMKTSMSTENFFKFFLLSQQHSDSELSEAAIDFFLEYSEEIVEIEKWTEFIKECPDETSVLIKVLVKQNIKAKRGVFC